MDDEQLENIENPEEEPEEVKTDIGTVRIQKLETEMETSYLAYAMSVIIARALPDVRDGLKPVARSPQASCQTPNRAYPSISKMK